MNETVPESMNERTVIVPHDRLGEFEKTLKGLNAKATKFGLPAVDVVSRTTALFVYRREIDPVFGEKVSITLSRVRPGQRPPMNAEIVRAYDIALKYPVIKLGQWRVMAQVEKVGENNLIFAIDGGPDDFQHIESHRTAEIVCEHCKAARTRKLSYLLKDEATAAWKQVGSTCLQDFTGIDPASALFLAKMYQVVSLYGDDEMGGYSRGASSVLTRDYLARVCFLVERSGFASSAKAKNQGCRATYEQAWYFKEFLDHRDNRALAEVYENDYKRFAAQAGEVMKLYAAHEPKDSFDQNVKLLLSSPDLLLERKHLAFAAAAVPSYLRYLAVQKEAQAERDNPSKHIGAVGDKLEMKLSLHRVFGFDTAFGRAYRVSLRDTAGNHLSWKTASPPEDLLKSEAIGTRFEAKFTVKNHDEYKGSLVTQITRLKVKEMVAAAA